MQEAVLMTYGTNIKTRLCLFVTLLHGKKRKYL